MSSSIRDKTWLDGAVFALWTTPWRRRGGYVRFDFDLELAGQEYGLWPGGLRNRHGGICVREAGMCNRKEETFLYAGARGLRAVQGRIRVRAH